MWLTTYRRTHGPTDPQTHGPTKRCIEPGTLAKIDWIQLLQARTTGYASEIVEDGESLQRELGAAESLAFIWSELDVEFITDDNKPSQDLLQDLQFGPRIAAAGRESLREFSRHCRKAVKFMEHDERLGARLDGASTQRAIARRLYEPLLSKWEEERLKYVRSHQMAPFAQFAEWISLQAKVAMNREHTPNTPSK